MLLGRIDSADVFAGKAAALPSGYVFKISATGDWALLCSQYKKPTVSLAQGALHINTGRWHTMLLAFQGNRISASLDGKLLASVTDRTHPHGMVGVGTGWNTAQFNRLSVQ